MSVALLEKLKIKPKPSSKDAFSVNIPTKKQGVEVKISIVNKTKQPEINIMDFVKKFKHKKKVQLKSPILGTMKPVESKTFMKTIGKPNKLGRRIALILSPEDEKKRPKIKRGKSLRITDTATVKFKTPPVIDHTNLDAEFIETYLPKENQLEIPLSPYYLKNRKYFISHLTKIFSTYKTGLDDAAEKVTCESIAANKGGDTPFSLLTHQKIVKEYINLYTPYRGLLLYHGLGAGKTCASIAIMEGIKTHKKVIIMTPASLRKNYQKQLKECGDPLYRLEQHWEFLPIDVMSADEKILNSINYITSLPKNFLKQKKGVWLSNVSLPSNYKTLSQDEKNSINEQIDKMLNLKYTFINYNGLREAAVINMTNNYTNNIFDDSIVIIDEAHNFVSRIVNKLKSPESVSKKLYELLVDAHNTKVVLLSGTPMINYPNELGIMFNIINGSIKTWEIKINVLTKITVDQGYFEKLLYDIGVMDYFDYNTNKTTLTVSKNPYGFLNTQKKGKYTGVMYDEQARITDEEFIEMVKNKIRKDGNFEIISENVLPYKLLPDSLDAFKKEFITSKNTLKNPKKFQQRIMGLTSYFKSASENLMPEITAYHKVYINLSDYQLGFYAQARKDERKLETENARKKKKDPLFENGVSTYRIFSRAFCNFVFPEGIQRPMPTDGEEVDIGKTEMDEDILDAPNKEELENNPDGRYDVEDIETKSPLIDETYEERLQTALTTLKANSSKFLTKDGLVTYSPKFLHMLENLEDHSHNGLHLIYSQFRTLEGIGVLKLVLEENDFVHFKLIKNDAGIYVANISSTDIGKPAFALYTGTESAEEKEIIRNIYNNDWSDLTTPLQESLKQISTSNLYGEIIKVLMISSSGAEGINLKNVRYVHITEPYWHPVRVEQVIGRARRICSHESLPKDLQNIEVFFYLMKFSDEQISSSKYKELINKDKDVANKKSITSDEKLLEISELKNRLNKELLMAIKTTSMDCLLHSKDGKVDEDGAKCMTLASTYTNKFSYEPSYEKGDSDTVSVLNVTKELIKAKEFVYKGKKYAIDPNTRIAYDYDMYTKKKQTIKVGMLIETEDKKLAIELD